MELTRLNEEYRQRITQDKEAHALSAAKEIEYMAQSTAKYHGRCVSTLYIPKIFTEQDIKRFRELIQTLYGIFDKVIERYRKDAGYRELFGFDKRLEELILREKRYSCNIPIARIDIFYDEDTGNFKFCEFNTDGSSAMNEDRELNRGIKKTLGYKQLADLYHISTFELFDSWAQESLRIYHSAKGAVESPHVAIVDFMESATNNEFEIFADSYRKLGLSCEICEIRKLRYEKGRLYGEGNVPIDMIYRRAVTSDIMKHYDEVADFIQAVKEESVCLLGDFTTQIVHNKVLYRMLHHPMTQEFLREEENEFVEEHVPYTAYMDAPYIDVDNICANKNGWILKPQDSYGSKGVFAGVEFESVEEWRKIVEEHRTHDYLLQQFCTPYQTLNIDFSKGKDTEFLPVYNLTGLFVYGGNFQGIYSRVSRGEIISTQYSEIALPTIIVAEKEK
ncbi:MAG: glutathionylspermidine synthase family protein [Roseburia sp.]|nr:glutathionylspermidine synthase family protein [Roseburia sp.]